MDSIALGMRPLVTVEHLSDPTASGAGREGIVLDAVQLPSQPLRARRVIVRLRTRTRVEAGQIACVSFGAASRGTAGGSVVGPGMLLAAAPDAEACFVVEAGWESITDLLPPATVREQLDARRRGDEWRVPRGLELMQADPARVRELHASGAASCRPRWPSPTASTAVCSAAALRRPK